MRPRWLIVLPLALLCACSVTYRKEARLYAAGENATAGPLVYSLIDSQISQTLGDDSDNPRTPRNRFVVVQISVSNSSNQDVLIPAMTLVGDSGETYPELADGTGVHKWMGVVRKVGPAQTEEGYIVFDAPAKHYRLRLTGDAEAEVAIDIPLSFIHEMKNVDVPVPEKDR